MRWLLGAVCTFLTILVVTPAHASDEGAAPDEPRRFTVHFGLGSHLHDGGNAQSLAFGFGLSRSVSVLVNVERNYVPTRVETYPDGYAATRGGTLTFISGELRYVVPIGERLSPFILIGRGVGLAQPNANEIFPATDPYTADVLYAGAGVRIPIRPRLQVFAGAKLVLHVGRNDAMAAMLPISAGVTWGF